MRAAALVVGVYGFARAAHATHVDIMYPAFVPQILHWPTPALRKRFSTTTITDALGDLVSRATRLALLGPRGYVRGLIRDPSR
jgi:hypothetical protein